MLSICCLHLLFFRNIKVCLLYVRFLGAIWALCMAMKYHVSDLLASFHFSDGINVLEWKSELNFAGYGSQQRWLGHTMCAISFLWSIQELYADWCKCYKWRWPEKLEWLSWVSPLSTYIKGQTPSCLPLFLILYFNIFSSP